MPIMVENYNLHLHFYPVKPLCPPMELVALCRKSQGARRQREEIRISVESPDFSKAVGALLGDNPEARRVWGKRWYAIVRHVCNCLEGAEEKVYERKIWKSDGCMYAKQSWSALMKALRAMR